MKSNKQRRAELTAKRKAKLKKQAAEKEARRRTLWERKMAREVVVNVDALAHDNSYDDGPDFVKRGYYIDVPFQCCDCGKEEVWTATRQKWWYEVAKGGRWTKAIRCRQCRRRERTRRNNARRVHLEGIARKQK